MGIFILKTAESRVTTLRRFLKMAVSFYDFMFVFVMLTVAFPCLFVPCNRFGNLDYNPCFPFITGYNRLGVAD